MLPGQLRERILEPRNLYILELSFFGIVLVSCGAL